MSSRDRILSTLRANRPPFENEPPRPDHYLPVTALTDESPYGLLARFTVELERLTGSVFAEPNPEAAVARVLTLVGDDNRVLAWDDLPLTGLADALKARGISASSPKPRHEQRAAVLQALESIRVGITGVDAGLASTGTLALVTSPAHGRIVSLLPSVHIALLRRERLVANMEAWIAADGKHALAESSSVIFVTGPSRTSDIEMQTILGVHGPRSVQVVVW